MKLLNEFVIKGSPSTRTAQQKGVRVVRGMPIFFEKEKVKLAKDILKSGLICHIPDEPYEGPLCVRLMWLFDKKTMTKAEDNTFKISSPDVDNLAKGCLDCITDCGYWKDDNQIAKLDLIKGWSKQFPGLFVQIWQLTEEDFDTYILGWREQAV